MSHQQSRVPKYAAKSVLIQLPQTVPQMKVRAKNNFLTQSTLSLKFFLTRLITVITPLYLARMATRTLKEFLFETQENHTKGFEKTILRDLVESIWQVLLRFGTPSRKSVFGWALTPLLKMPPRLIFLRSLNLGQQLVAKQEIKPIVLWNQQQHHSRLK
ncbi:unnamed protein product [Ilex paraguariensis]|uniref:Uncharacterized protein n=1 Tax=Ilex paraguariensis TaxID=185542 RepID=A0ABC8RRZ4_9AQUA